MTIALSTWVVAGVIAVASVAVGVQTMRLSSEQTAHADERAAHASTKRQYADDRVEAIRLYAKAETAQRNEFDRRLKEQKNVVDQAQSQTAAARTDLALANDAYGRLRSQVAITVARARQASGGAVPGVGSAPTSDPTGMLAELFDRIDQRAGILAAYADSARIAGQACERSYDSLTPKLAP